MSDTAESQARAQVASVVAMVAALNVDYDRLEELREERDNLHGTLAGSNGVLEQREKTLGKPGAPWDGKGLLPVPLSYSTAEEVEEARKEVSSVSEELQRVLAELADLEDAAGDNTSEDEAREAIEGDALSVEVRSGWHELGAPLVPEEFRIVLCTGGPHVELVGDLDRGTPSRIRVIYKDWGTSGEYFPDSAEREALETYCAQFYFGE